MEQARSDVLQNFLSEAGAALGRLRVNQESRAMPLQ